MTLVSSGGESHPKMVSAVRKIRFMSHSGTTKIEYQSSHLGWLVRRGLGAMTRAHEFQEG
jgi:hypothetical protein